MHTPDSCMQNGNKHRPNCTAREDCIQARSGGWYSIQKNPQARISPSTVYQCRHADSTVHRLYVVHGNKNGLGYEADPPPPPISSATDSTVMQGP